MSPSSFSFTLTVPNDPQVVGVVAEVARHATEYVKLEGGAAKGFVERVRTLAAQALKGAPGQHCLAEVGAADGQLTITIDGTSVSHPLA